MRNLLIITLTIVSIKSHAQCGGEYVTGLYHISEFINEHGDTLNKTDSKGLYQGMHLYSDNKYNLLSDTTEYTIGQYENGYPVGKWKEHCKNGQFSHGQYNAGIKEKFHEKGGWITHKQGAYNKIGVWDYFDKDSNLIQTLRYDRFFNHKGWTNETYFKNQKGDFILIYYEFNNRSSLNSPFKKKIEKVFDKTNRTIISFRKEGAHQSVYVKYRSSGVVLNSTKQRYSRRPGYLLETTIEKQYTLTGKIKSKRKTRLRNYDHYETTFFR